MGLNVNFLSDHAEMRSRGRGYVASMKKLGVRSLRYPGGEKSNEYFWSRPPWEKSSPTLALRGPEARLFVESTNHVTESGDFLVTPMDFDEFMDICREVGAEPMVCVNVGSAYVINKPGRLTGSTRAQQIENAVEWVRYANKVKGYGIRYWEIGNESYWRGSVATLTAAQYTREILELSRAMKAVDPSILIGANGHVDKDYVSTADNAEGPIWWQHVLENAAPAIDFLVVHPYPCFEWGNYDYFVTNTPKLTHAVDQAIAALQTWAPAEASRIRILATETNAFDWAASKWYQGARPGWPWANDLGHALVLFDLIGQHLVHDHVDGIQVWTSRWFSSDSRLEDVLDDQNDLLPTGLAMSLWGCHLGSTVQSVPSDFPGPVYASATPGSSTLTLFIVNKHRNPMPVRLDLVEFPAPGSATTLCLTGRGPEDKQPRIMSGPPLSITGTWLDCSLPAVSINVIKLERSRNHEP
jgi:alpha-L-arabinofuranosidase